MNKTHVCAAIAAGLSLSISAYAGSGIAVNGVSPRAKSMQAYTAVSDDPSAVYYNPAGLTQVKGTRAEVGANVINAHQRFSNSSNGMSSSSRQVAPAPDFFVSTDRVNHVVLGFGAYVPFARSTRFRKNGAVLNLPQQSKVVRVDYVPTIAFNIGHFMSIGAGLVMSQLDLDVNILGFEEIGHGSGYTGQVGVMFYLPKHVKLGVTYHGREVVHTTGHGDTSTQSGKFTSDIHFPGILNAGIAWQPTNALVVNVQYDLEMWNYLRNIKRNYDNPILDSLPGTNTIINGINSQLWHIGARYICGKNEFRAGYSYVPTATPKDNIIPAQPDYNVNAVSIGYSRYYNQWRIDVGYEYDRALNVVSNNSTFPGTHKMFAHNYMLGLAYNFS